MLGYSKGCQRKISYQSAQWDSHDVVVSDLKVVVPSLLRKLVAERLAQMGSDELSSHALCSYALCQSIKCEGFAIPIGGAHSFRELRSSVRSPKGPAMMPKGATVAVTVGPTPRYTEVIHQYLISPTRRERAEALPAQVMMKSM